MKGLPDPGLHDESVGVLISRAVADVQHFARAEIELQKTRAVVKLGEAQSAATMLVGALVAGSMALTGLVVGALLILQRPLGPVWATVIVVGTLAIVAGLLGWLALNRFKAVFGAGGNA